MADILLKLVKKNGKICVSAVVRETRQRHYKVVEGLKNPNLKTWDKQRQIFDRRSLNADFNNNLLEEVMGELSRLRDERRPLTRGAWFRLQLRSASC